MAVYTVQLYYKYISGRDRARDHPSRALFRMPPVSKPLSVYIRPVFRNRCSRTRKAGTQNTATNYSSTPYSIRAARATRRVCIALIYGCIDHRNDGFKQARKLCTQTEVTQRR